MIQKLRIFLCDFFSMRFCFKDELFNLPFCVGQLMPPNAIGRRWSSAVTFFHIISQRLGWLARALYKRLTVIAACGLRHKPIRHTVRNTDWIKKNEGFSKVYPSISNKDLPLSVAWFLLSTKLDCFNHSQTRSSTSVSRYSRPYWTSSSIKCRSRVSFISQLHKWQFQWGCWLRLS